MPITASDICCGLAESARSPDTYRKAVLEFLYQAASGGGGTLSAGSISAGSTSASLGQVVFSNSNNVSFGMNGNTVTASIVPAEVKDIIIGGNTSGVLATISSGTMLLAGGNNVTLSQNGNSVTISGASQSSVNFSNSNNVSFGLAGSTLTASASFSQSSQPQSSLSFSNLNGVSFGTAGSTLTASVAAQSSLNYSNFNNVSFGLAGSTLTASASFSQSSQPQSSLSFSNLNGVTFGTAGSTLTASVAAQSSLSFSNLNGVTFGTVGSTLTASVASQSVQPQSSLSFSNLNGVTFGTAGSTLTASVASQSVQTQGLFDLQIGGNTSGTTALVSTGTLTLAGGNNITLSQAGNAITISGAAFNTYSSTVLGAAIPVQWGNSSLDQNTLYICPENLKGYVSATALKLPVSCNFSSSASNSCQVGHTFQLGIYTRQATNNTVLSRHYSTSYTLAGSLNSNTSAALSAITAIGNSTSYNTIGSTSTNGIALSSLVHGIREFIMPVSSVFTPGEYWFAYLNSSSSAGGVGNVLRLSAGVGSYLSGNAIGLAQTANGAGVYRDVVNGTYSATTGAMPAAISMTEIFQTGIMINAFLVSATA